jgi:hypothetical protein
MHEGFLERDQSIAGAEDPVPANEDEDDDGYGRAITLEGLAAWVKRGRELCEAETAAAAEDARRAERRH